MVQGTEQGRWAPFACAKARSTEGWPCGRVQVPEKSGESVRRPLWSAGPEAMQRGAAMCARRIQMLLLS